jgi:hypothetical protein
MMRRYLLLALVSIAAVSCMCGSRVIARTSRGFRTVTVFERDCGATTASSTQVSVQWRWSVLGSGNAFVADRLSNDNAVTARWLSDREVEIQYPASARVFRSESSANGVRIRYRPYGG